MKDLLQILAVSKECLPHSPDTAMTPSKTILLIMIIYESLLTEMILNPCWNAATYERVDTQLMLHVSMKIK